MDCPKCGVEQDDGREECLSCGIVFARWYAAQHRRIAQTSVPVESPAAGVAVSRGVIFIAVFVLIIFGALWTKSRRDARANRDLRKEGMAMLNDINKKGNKERQRLEAENERARKMAAAMTERPRQARPRPIGFEEADAMRLLEQCAAFTERSSIRFPRVYHEGAEYSEAYPSLGRALELRIVEKMNRDGQVTLWPGPGVGGLVVLNQGDEYHIDLGMRRVQEITELSGDVDRAEARFRWMWQGRVAAETLLSTSDTYGGVAEFLRQGGVWRVTGATLRQEDGTGVSACR